MADKFDKMATGLAEKIGNVIYGCSDPKCGVCGPTAEQLALIAAALRSAVEEEREACALIADNDTTKSLLEPRNDAERRYRNGYNDGAADANEHVARDIRARGEVKR